ncbi:MAG: hypothetical protein NVSMB45_13780 [Ginsengibacter sp.]
MIVESELLSLNIPFHSVSLGEAEISGEISALQRNELRFNLLQSGLELMDDSRSMIIEKIKNVIIEMVHYADELPKVNNSIYIAKKLNYDYTYLSNLFSEVIGTTIEHFIIIHKIEKVKELLVYDELNLTEIASKLYYSSVSHLSNQFKKITGLTPSHFKKLKNKRRIALEQLSNKSNNKENGLGE